MRRVLVVSGPPASLRLKTMATQLCTVKVHDLGAGVNPVVSRSAQSKRIATRPSVLASIASSANLDLLDSDPLEIRRSTGRRPSR